MKLSCSAYQTGSGSYAQKILSGQLHSNYGATSSSANTTGESTQGLIMPSWKVEEIEGKGSPNDNSESPNEGSSSYGQGKTQEGRTEPHDSRHTSISSHSDGNQAERQSDSTSKTTHDSSRSPSESPAHHHHRDRIGLENRSRSKSVGEQQWTNLRTIMRWYSSLRRIRRSKSNQRWMKLRTTVQLSGAISSTIQKKTTLKREDSFLKRFSTRQVPEAQETFEIGEDDASGSGGNAQNKYRRKKKRSLPRSVVNPDGNFYFYWLFLLTVCVLYNLWTLIVRESFPELQSEFHIFWIVADAFTDVVILLDLAVQMRTCYLEQGLMVYKTKKLATHYVGSKNFWFDLSALLPTDLLQFHLGVHPMLRVPRFLKTYRMYSYYYMVESRTVYPNVWRVVNLIHVLLLLAHWFGCFYYLLSEAENFAGQWVYPDPARDPSYAPLTRKYLASLYWSTLTLTTIGDLPTPYSNWQIGNRSVPFDPNDYSGYRTHSHKSRLLHIRTNTGYLFTIVSYLIGVFIFATIVGQVGNVITNRNANRLEFERLLDGAKMYMRHHRVPRDMQRRVLRWYDYSWSRGRIQGGGDINTALGLLPDKLKTELALHVNLSVLKKVTIFQECQPEFLHDLVLKMKAYIFTPGDLICRKGEVAREMFIIADGILEVISETGRVLTTMQAGDFFGEIGILNLDGLNKRTADVRSVGYSELFSLSREDVLAAMKDYPEAQEILQTLGRKRLMEARKANAPYTKKTCEKKSPLHLLGQSMAKCMEDAGDSTGKKIVEKLRSDVKGLRNAIRKSRKSNSSKEDSSEPESGKDKYEGGVGGVRRKESTVSVQQYYGGGRMSIVGSMLPSSSASRGVLKRMHNIVLSDEKEKVGIGGDTSMSNRSPTILPKRVQVQLPVQDTGPREVIGAGLPLIQRLRLLRQKEEAERKTQEPPTEPPPTFQTKVSVEPPPKTEKRARTASESSSGPVQLSPAKTPPAAATLRLSPESRATSNESNTSVVSETVGAGGTDPGGGREEGKDVLRPSALRFQKKDAKTYGSVDDLSPEFSRLPFIRKLQILNERQKIAQILTNKPANPSLLTRSTSEGSSELPPTTQPLHAETLYSVVMGRRTQSHSEEYRNRHPGRKAEPPPFPLNLPSPSSSSDSGSDEETKKEAPSKSKSPSPPCSPEWNETPERRHLKSILKTLSKSAGSGEEESDKQTRPPTEEPSTDVVDYQLLRAPTVEGYAARHRKFAKNVTFQRQAVTVLSPDGDGFIGLETRVTETQEQVEESGEEKKTEAEPDGGGTTGDPVPPVPFSITPEALKKARVAELSLLLRQGNGTEGLDAGGLGLSLGRAVAQEECIGGVFLGIKNIIQAKMEELQSEFQDRFCTLETEVRQRDQTIALLQLRLQELETKGLSRPSRTRPLQNHATGHDDGYDEDEEEEELNMVTHGRLTPVSYLFSRGDSIDTVIDNTEEFEDDEVFSPAEPGEAQLASSLLQTDWEAEEQEAIEMREMGRTEVPLWQLEFHREPDHEPTDSVALDIGNTSTEYESSSSSDKDIRPTRQVQETPLPLGDSDQGDWSEEETTELDNTNWEVQMLAREMARREEAEEELLEEEAAEDLAVDEMLELDSEFQEMRDVVSSGALSPTELDMLEAVLESRTKRVKALSKAFSTDVPGSAGVGRMGEGMAEDFRPRGSSLQFPYSHSPLAHIHAAIGASAPFRRSRQLSPAESRREVSGSGSSQTRKRANVRRQASLCETSQRTPTKLTGRRRESAGSLGKGVTEGGPAPASPKSSILSRFSFIRSLSRALLHSNTSEETPSEPVPSVPPPKPSVPIPVPSSNLSRFSSASAGLLPIVSSPSALPSSIQSDPGRPPETPSIFTIPHPLSVPPPTEPTQTESQPLLQK